MAGHIAKSSKDGTNGGGTLVLNKDPRKAMQEMMDIIDGLKSTMHEETEAVRQSDIKLFAALQEKKMVAATLYQDGVNQMIARKEEMKAVPTPLKEQLAAKRTDFMHVARENMRMLERMRTSMQRLSDRIMRAAKAEVESTTKFVYGAHGKLEGSGKASLGINERA